MEDTSLKKAKSSQKPPLRKSLESVISGNRRQFGVITEEDIYYMLIATPKNPRSKAKIIFREIMNAWSENRCY